MRRVPVVPLAQRSLVVGLLLATFFAPGAYAVVAGGLALLNALALIRAAAPPVRLALSTVTAVLFPLCAEAGGAGFAAIAGTLLALPGAGDALRSLALTANRASRDQVHRAMFSARQLSGRPLFVARRIPLPALRALILAGVVVVTLGLAAGRWVLVGAGAVFLGWLLALVGFVLLRLPLRFLEADSARLRALVAKRSDLAVVLRPHTPLPCILRLHSFVPWVEVSPAEVRIDGSRISAHLAVTPPLAGPSELALDVLAIDPWGLTGTLQSVEVTKLHIIPRARYAAWLARRYLERTPPGLTGMMSAATFARRGVRGGMEYYGARSYAPGDSLRDIDWKHTVKLREIVVKEFHMVAGQAAVLVVRLDAGDADAVDRLAYGIVTTTLTLAQEGIPMVLAGYTEHDVVGVTMRLAPRAAVRQALELTGRIVLAASARRSLAFPHLGRLRRMRRLLAGTEPARRLSDLLGLEIEAIADRAATHPAGRAARLAVRQVQPPAAVLTIAAAGDDDTALDVALGQLSRLGYRRVWFDPVTDGRTGGRGMGVDHARQARRAPR